ncbi:MAG: galactokinase [Bdellovibrionaceae bacterium]|nr:galactokinase [Pseudobdellovibrionaceae bacterium]
MSPKIKITSPTRVDLAGGTLDLWPLYAFIGGATTVNVAISLWTECEMEPFADGVSIHSDDLKKSWTFPGRATLVSSTDPELAFYRTLFEAVPDLDHVAVRTRSQSPVGGGIGGSSSLLISCLKAAHEFTGQILPGTIELTMWAHQLEARMLRTPTGTQDYVPAITGGLNLIHFSDRKMTNEVLPVKGTPLETHFLLVNTGRSHHSGLNNFDVLARTVNRDEVVFGALKSLKSVANELVTAIRGRDWSVVPDLFRRELDARLQLTPKFSSPEIEKLHDLSRQEGASALKICGAGGGGCVMIWVEPRARERVVHACQNAGFQTLNAAPVDPL